MQAGRPDQFDIGKSPRNGLPPKRFATPIMPPLTLNRARSAHYANESAAGRMVAPGQGRARPSPHGAMPRAAMLRSRTRISWIICQFTSQARPSDCPPRKSRSTWCFLGAAIPAQPPAGHKSWVDGKGYSWLMTTPPRAGPAAKNIDQNQRRLSQQPPQPTLAPSVPANAANARAQGVRAPDAGNHGTVLEI